MNEERKVREEWVEWGPCHPGMDGPLAALAGLSVVCRDEEWVLAEQHHTPTHTIEEQETRGSTIWIRIAPRLVISLEVTLLPTEGTPPDTRTAQRALEEFLLGAEVVCDGSAFVVTDVDS